MDVIERFLKYVAVDTESAEDAACFPSSEKQKNLARMFFKGDLYSIFFSNNALVCGSPLPDVVGNF